MLRVAFESMTLPGTAFKSNVARARASHGGLRTDIKLADSLILRSEGVTYNIVEDEKEKKLELTSIK